MPTPWSSSSSLVSDRIRPHPHPQPPKQQQQQQQNRGKGKGKTPTPEPPKSNAVRVLEARLDSARGSNGHVRDPKGGCFCQARKHALSSYVPMCRRCGLILCTLNPPHYACPHCASALMDERERGVLVGRLEGELAEQMAREVAERQRVIEEARAAEGAFPMLPGPQTQLQMARTSRTPPPPPLTTTTTTAPSTTRTVLSLNSETKKVTVSSYSMPMATLSRPASRGQDREEEEGRASGPPGEVRYVTESRDPGRPWKNTRVGDVRYVALPGGTTGDTSKQGRKRKGAERGTAGAGTGG